MYRRPIYIALIGGCLGWIGAIGIVISFRDMFLTDDDGLAKLAQTTGLPGNLVLALNVVVAIIFFVCGVNILNGANWARWLYTLTTVCLLIGDATSLMDQYAILTVLVAILRVAVLIFLFLPDANDFFSSPQM